MASPQFQASADSHAGALRPYQHTEEDSPGNFPAPGFNADALRISIRQRTERYSNLQSHASTTEAEDFRGVQQNLSRDLRVLLGATRNLETRLGRERRQKWFVHATM